MALVTIKGLDKAEVLLALWNSSKMQGMSFLGYNHEMTLKYAQVGIVVDNLAIAIYDLANTLQSIIDEDSESDLADDAETLIEYDGFDTCSTDNMGLQYIVYFTDITVAEEDE